MRALSDFLWHERDVLELLLHRLETERALLATARTRRLPLAGREVEAALEQLRAAELARATETVAATEVLGLPSAASLRTIAASAPVPWGDILLDHHAELRDLVEEIITLTEREPAASPASGDGNRFLDLPDGLGTLEDVDGEISEAVVELEIREIGRRATAARRTVLRKELVDFLA